MQWDFFLSKNLWKNKNNRIKKNSEVNFDVSDISIAAACQQTKVISQQRCQLTSTSVKRNHGACLAFLSTLAPLYVKHSSSDKPLRYISHEKYLFIYFFIPPFYNFYNFLFYYGRRNFSMCLCHFPSAGQRGPTFDTSILDKNNFSVDIYQTSSRKIKFFPLLEKLTHALIFIIFFFLKKMNFFSRQGRN